MVHTLSYLYAQLPQLTELHHPQAKLIVTAAACLQITITLKMSTTSVSAMCHLLSTAESGLPLDCSHPEACPVADWTLNYPFISREDGVSDRPKMCAVNLQILR